MTSTAAHVGPRRHLLGKNRFATFWEHDAIVSHAIGQHHVVKPVPAETKTQSGIIIPDSAKEKPLKGTVVLVGAAKKDEAVEVKVGDTVLYGKYSGTELQIDGEDYLLINQSDVLYVA